MKKITAFVFAAFMFLSLGFVSCSKKSDSSKSITPAQALCQQFKEIIKEDSNIGVESLAEFLAGNEVIEFGPVVMPVEEGYLNGFNDPIHGFKEGEIFAPMIGSIPFVGYVFKTNNPDALMATLKEKADLRWNICTQADEMVVDSVNDYVFFVMAPVSFEQEL